MRVILLLSVLILSSQNLMAAQTCAGVFSDAEVYSAAEFQAKSYIQALLGKVDVLQRAPSRQARNEIVPVLATYLNQAYDIFAAELIHANPTILKNINDPESLAKLNFTPMQNGLLEVMVLSGTQLGMTSEMANQVLALRLNDHLPKEAVIRRPIGFVEPKTNSAGTEKVGTLRAGFVSSGEKFEMAYGRKELKTDRPYLMKQNIGFLPDRLDLARPQGFMGFLKPADKFIDDAYDYKIGIDSKSGEIVLLRSGAISSK